MSFFSTSKPLYKLLNSLFSCPPQGLCTFNFLRLSSSQTPPNMSSKTHGSSWKNKITSCVSTTFFQLFFHFYPSFHCYKLPKYSFFSFFGTFFFWWGGCICSTQKFQDQGSNLCHNWDQSHSSDNTRSLTCCTTRELPWHIIYTSWITCFLSLRKRSIHSMKAEIKLSSSRLYCTSAVLRTVSDTR